MHFCPAIAERKNLHHSDDECNPMETEPIMSLQEVESVLEVVPDIRTAKFVKEAQMAQVHQSGSRAYLLGRKISGRLSFYRYDVDWSARNSGEVACLLSSTEHLRSGKVIDLALMSGCQCANGNAAASLDECMRSCRCQTLTGFDRVSGYSRIRIDQIIAIIL
jgi:hypothetical protein